MAKEPSWHFTPEDVNALHSRPADHRIYYGSDALQYGDLRLPNGPGPYPVAIIIHGGCWLSKFATAQNTSALADALRDSGIATWNIQYRSVDNSGGGWPGTFIDVANGTDFLRTIAKKYSLDLNHIVVIGHSAGGHLALWLSARHQLPTNSQLYTKDPIALQGVIALGAVPDLKAFRQQGKMICGFDVIEKLLGNSQDVISKHYKESSPTELLPLGIPQIFIYGDEDNIVPKQYGIAYMQSARMKGDNVKLITVKYAGHHEYNVPRSVTWPVIKSAVLSLLR